MITSFILAFLAVSVSVHPSGDNSVTLNNKPVAVRAFLKKQSSRVFLFELPPTDAISEPFDAVLLQGVLPGPKARILVGVEENEKIITWQQASVKVFENGRFWARAVWNGPKKGVLHVRATAAEFYQEPLTIYSIETFLSTGQPSPELSAPSVKPLARWQSVERPAIIDRKIWHAKPPKKAYQPLVPERYTQHHTSGHRTFSFEDSLAEVGFIQDFHQNGRGWSDIGYHFVIDGEGRIFEGRPVEVLGAHAKNHNTGNVGVAFLGYYQRPVNDRLNERQIESAIDLYAWLSSTYQVDPDSLRGHLDYKDTDCPGDLVYVLLDDFKAKIRERLKPAALDLSAATR